MPRGTTGSATKVSSVRKTDSSRVFSAGVRASVPLPTRSASARIGIARGSTRTPGRSSRNSAALLTRNGRWRGNSRIATSSVGGDCEMNSWMNGRATGANAAKVMSRLRNSAACCSATGATSLAAASSERKKRPSCVCGDARFCATGSRRSTSGRSAAIAVFRSGPRPANASPKPCRLRWMPVRVGLLNVLNTWSISTGAGRALRSGIVSPARSDLDERPCVISTYFRPSAERGRTMNVESARSGSTVLSSLSESSADVLPSAERSALMSLTTPTRSPPMRTSFPTTRLAAFGTRAFRS
jgi:hypothetical protein